MCTIVCQCMLEHSELRDGFLSFQCRSVLSHRDTHTHRQTHTKRTSTGGSGTMHPPHQRSHTVFTTTIEVRMLIINYERLQQDGGSVDRYRSTVWGGTNEQSPME